MTINPTALVSSPARRAHGDQPRRSFSALPADPCDSGVPVVFRGIPVDRLVGRASAPVQVSEWEGVTIGSPGSLPREPHRHDYHELIWVRSGSGEHVIDGQPLDVVPHTITPIGRGQVHVFARARDVTGATVRFNDDVLHGDASEQMIRSWLFSGPVGRSVPVPVAKIGALGSTIAALAAETAVPADMCSTEIQRHLLAVLLHWSERWADAVRSERPGDADVQLHRRFAALVEDDFALRHDAAHYADALGVPQAKLSRALSRITGRSTKELILDRVMIEAARLVRFTDVTVGPIAAATGFSDPLYFSRVFKRHHVLRPALSAKQVVDRARHAMGSKSPCIG